MLEDCRLWSEFGSVSTSSVFGTLVGSRCWMAPEVFTSVPNSVDKTPFAEESDVFSCGMILHYILSGGKHPFSPKDCTNENALISIYNQLHPHTYYTRQHNRCYRICFFSL